MKKNLVLALLLVGSLLSATVAHAGVIEDTHAMALLTALNANGAAGITAVASLKGTTLTAGLTWGAATPTQKQELHDMCQDPVAWNEPTVFVTRFVAANTLRTELAKTVVPYGVTGIVALAEMTGKVIPATGTLTEEQMTTLFGLLFKDSNEYSDAYYDPPAFAFIQARAYDLTTAIQGSDPITKTGFENLFGCAPTDPTYASMEYLLQIFSISCGPYYVSPSVFITYMDKAHALDVALQGASDAAKATFATRYGVAIPPAASDDPVYVAKLFSIDYTTTEAFLASLETPTGKLGQVLALDADARTAFENLYDQPVDGSPEYLDIVGTLEVANGIVDFTTAQAFAAVMKETYALHQAVIADAAVPTAATAFAAIYGETPVDPAGTDADYVAVLYGITGDVSYLDAATSIAYLKAAYAMDQDLRTDAGFRADFLRIYQIAALPATAAGDPVYVQCLFDIVATGSYSAAAFKTALDKVDALDVELQGRTGDEKAAFEALYGATATPATTAERAAYIGELFGIVSGSYYVDPATFLTRLLSAYNLDLALRDPANAAAKAVFQSIYGVTVPANSYDDPAYVTALFSVTYTDLAAYIAALTTAGSVTDLMDLDPVAQAAFTNLYTDYGDEPEYSAALSAIAASGVDLVTTAGQGAFIVSMKQAHALDQALRTDTTGAQAAFLRLYGITITDPVTTYARAIAGGYVAKLYALGATTVAQIKAAAALDEALQTADPSVRTAFLDMYNADPMDPLTNAAYLTQLYSITGYYVSATDRYTTPAAYIAALSKAYALDQELRKAENADALARFQDIYACAIGTPPYTSVGYVVALFSAQYTDLAAYVSSLNAASLLDGALQLDADAQAAFENIYDVIFNSVEYLDEVAAIVGSGVDTDAEVAAYIIDLKNAHLFDQTIRADATATARAAFLRLYGVAVPAGAANAGTAAGYAEKLFMVVTQPTYVDPLSSVSQMIDAYALDQALKDNEPAKIAFQALYNVASLNPLDAIPAGREGYVATLYGIISYYVDATDRYTDPATYIAKLLKAYNLDQALRASANASAKSVFETVYGLTVPTDPAYTSTAYVIALFSTQYTDLAAYIASLNSVNALDAALAGDLPAQAAFLNIYGVAFRGTGYTQKCAEIVSSTDLSTEAKRTQYLADLKDADLLDDALQPDDTAKLAFARIYGVPVPATASASPTYVAELFGIIGNPFYVNPAILIGDMKKAYQLDSVIQMDDAAKDAFKNIYGYAVPAAPSSSPSYLDDIFGIVSYGGYTAPEEYVDLLKAADALDDALRASDTARTQFQAIEGMAVPPVTSANDPYVGKLFSIAGGMWYVDAATYLAGLDKVYTYHQALIATPGAVEAFTNIYNLAPANPPSGSAAYIGKIYDIVFGEWYTTAAAQIALVIKASSLDRRLEGLRYAFKIYYGEPYIDPADQYTTNPLYLQKLFDRVAQPTYNENTFISALRSRNLSIHQLNSIDADLTYILDCQITDPLDPAFGAINNVHPGGTITTAPAHTHTGADATWIVPREMGMAIMGLMGAYNDPLTTNTTLKTKYLTAAQSAAAYLIKVQDTDGGWYNQYGGITPGDVNDPGNLDAKSKSPTQTAEVMMAFNKMGYDAAKYASMKKGAEFLLSCQHPVYGLLVGGKDSTGAFTKDIWASDNSYAYQALKAAEYWAAANGDGEFAVRCRAAAEKIIAGINLFLYDAAAGIWHKAIDSLTGLPVDPNGRGYEWINYAPAMLDLPVAGARSAALGTWIHDTFQLASGAVTSWTIGSDADRQSPGFAFQAMQVWFDLGQYGYIHQAFDWLQATTTGLWQFAPDTSTGPTDPQSRYGWIDWLDLSSGVKADDWQRFIDTSAYATMAMRGGYDFSSGTDPVWQSLAFDLPLYRNEDAYANVRYYPGTNVARLRDAFDAAGNLLYTYETYLSGALKAAYRGRDAGLTAAERSRLYNAAYSYIKYYADRAVASGTHKGLTLSFQGFLGGAVTDAEANLISAGASAYDQTILGMVQLYSSAAGNTSILDTYVAHYKLYVANPSYTGDSLFYDLGGYTDGAGNPVIAPYRFALIGSPARPGDPLQWDWTVDTGAAASLIEYAAKAYELYPDRTDYRDFALFLGEYLLKMQDKITAGGDGGVRAGPRGMARDADTNYYWNLKSTENNERCLIAFESLYRMTKQDADPATAAKYAFAAGSVKSWLANEMYVTDTVGGVTVGLFAGDAVYNSVTGQWVTTPLGYLPTDVAAFAPLEFMFTDQAFGADQAARNAAVDAMFERVEYYNAYVGADGDPVFFKFTRNQPSAGDYGSVEWSSQMAVAYLEAAYQFTRYGDDARATAYIKKYNTLMASLNKFFVSMGGGSLIAPYASYTNYTVAGGVDTGTGYAAFNCQGALASAYYALALMEGMKPWKYEFESGELSRIILANGKVKAVDRGPTIPSTPDANGDGPRELVLNYGAGSGLFFYDYANSKTFTKITSLTPTLLSSADLNGDGSQELLLDYGVGSGIFIYDYAGNKSFTSIAGTRPTFLSSADLDGDGDSELIFDFGAGIGLKAYDYATKSLTTITSSTPTLLASTDIDGDGCQDLIFDYGLGKGLYAYDFANNMTFTKISSSNPTLVAATDLNGDGSKDLVFDYGAGVGVYAFDFANNKTFTKISSSNPTLVAATDLNGDGSKDLVFNYGAGVGLYVYDYENGKTFTKITSLAPTLAQGDPDVIARLNLESDLNPRSVGSGYTMVGDLVKTPKDLLKK